MQFPRLEVCLCLALLGAPACSSSSPVNAGGRGDAGTTAASGTAGTAGGTSGGTGASGSSSAGTGVTGAGSTGGSGDGGASGAGNGTTADGGGTDAGANSGSADAEVDSGALNQTGCEAPSTPACSTCCEQEVGSCTIRAWTGDVGAANASYNSTSSESGTCEASCEPCAPCLEREKEAYDRAANSGCDCDSAGPPGVDACFGLPQPCACTCQGWADLKADCAP